VWEWLYRKFATTAAEMTNLPKGLRQRLDAEALVFPLERVYEQRSADRRTVKWLLRLPDGLTIETVLMRYDRRRTVCISTQVGCAMGCVFCATGQGGLARNLTAGEIVAQVLYAAHYLDRAPAADLADDGPHTLSAFSSCGSLPAHLAPEFPAEKDVPSPAGQRRLTNIVVMGMGEPFANYERTWAALRTITDPAAFGLGARHITVSTVGLPHGIRKMAAEPLQVNLAVSLHAPNDALRSKLLPANQRYPISEVMAAVREYIAATNRRVTFEYAMMAGINDAPELAVELAAWLRPLRSPTGGIMCHVNLISLNPVAESPYQPSTPEAVAAFQRILERNGVPATVRMRRGIDIDAGCGQLRQRIGEAANRRSSESANGEAMNSE
ncbi:MAG: 23S rRNA (adenine(2503)-C(2))-methyltransferase RlmN, partial [Anaerolineae bacterium]